MTSREKFEQAIKARFGDLIDYRVCKNSDGEYMAWDMQVAWWAWQAAETDMAVQLANAESKCRELAAELHSVKSAHQDAVDTIMNTASKGVVIYTEKPIQMSVATPIHDAYLAEVRAQGVEMAACALDDVNQFNYANMLDDLAQKIRQEAAQ